MELLKLLDHNIRAVPSAEASHIDEFRDIIDRDDSETKYTATRELAFVYHMVDHESPYAKSEVSLRQEKLIEDLFDGDWQPDEVIQAAMDKYVELNKTLYTELLESAEDAIRKLKDHFDEVDLTLLDDRGRAIYSAKDLIANIGKLGDLISSHKKLKEIVAKDQATGSRNKRGVEVNTFSE